MLDENEIEPLVAWLEKEYGVRVPPIAVLWGSRPPCCSKWWKRPHPEGHVQGFYGTEKGKPTIWVWSRGYDPLLAIAHEFHHHLNLRKNGRYDTPISGESDWGLEDRLTALAKADLKRYRLEKQVARIVEKALLGVSELQT